jgi:hypothetical protein
MAALDEENKGGGITRPAIPFNITPNDSDELTYVTRAFECDAAGDIHVIDADGHEDTYTIGAGMHLWRIKKVFASGTTVTNIIGLR